MSLTFSINLDTITESTRLESIYPALNKLPNNSAKLISPRDVRDSFLTAYSNSIFKVTTSNTGTIPYIGIDTNNPTNKDYKRKILLGKRSFGSLDIMTPSLLSSDTDIFFYNTKSDSLDQSSTKLTILAGTNSNYYPTAPYIESEFDVDQIKFNITNPLGNLDINSITGRVSINNINFPTVSETANGVADGKVLRYVGTYPTGKLEWVYPSVTQITIGTTASTTNIFGSPVLLNGYNLEFVEDELVPKTIGGVLIGSSFSSGSFNGQDWPLSEVIRKLLYPYVEPELNISVSNLTTNGGIYAEVGVTSSIRVDYDITRYSLDIDTYKIEYIPPTTQIVTGSYSGLPGTGVSSDTTINLFEGATGSVDFVLSAREVGSIGFSHSVTASIEFVHPIYYGFSGVSFSTSVGLDNFVSDSNTKKLIKPYGTQSYYDVDFEGTGYMYIAYPNLFNSGINNNINEIKDPNGFIVHDDNSFDISSFTYSTIFRTVPSLLQYKVWRTQFDTSWDGPSTFKFKF